MNRKTRPQIAGLLCICPLFAIAGCPFDVTSGRLPATLAGTYWVEYGDGALQAFVLPEYRGEEGRWLTLDTATTGWYSGPALYELHDDATWTRLTEGDLTLDDVLQTYDPPPRPAFIRQ